MFVIRKDQGPGQDDVWWQPRAYVCSHHYESKVVSVGVTVIRAMDL